MENKLQVSYSRLIKIFLDNCLMNNRRTMLYFSPAISLEIVSFTNSRIIILKDHQLCEQRN